jgi:hypothetical protein
VIPAATILVEGVMGDQKYKYEVTDSALKTHVVTISDPVPEAEFVEEGTPEWSDASAVLSYAIHGIAVDWKRIV